MIKTLFSFLFIITILNADNLEQDSQKLQTNEVSDELEYEILDDSENESKVDCLILQDENSIICKFETPRQNIDEQIIMQWIDPQGDVSRSRDMLVPAGHGSIYDYRYINGRLLGKWSFKVILNDKEYITEFELK